MAYRKLYDGDLVRVIDKSEHHGQDAVVLDTNETSAYVQLHCERAGLMSSECKWVNNNRLIIRDGGFVKDGRVDLEAQALVIQRIFESDEEDEECEYDGWDRDDLIERIKELESVIKQYEVRF